MPGKYEDAYYDRLQSALYSAVIADVLDGMGYRDQTMEAMLRPLTPDMILVGRAKTAAVVDVDRAPEVPHAKLLESLDSVRRGEVYVGAAGGSEGAALWGELLSTAARAAGGRGAVVDGLTRDVKAITAMAFPVFARGIRPTDSLGRIDVVDYDVSVECGGVVVNPGDLVMGDVDGVVVVPAEVEDAVIEAAFEKVSGENEVRDALREGMKASEAFEKFGVL